MTLLEHAAKIVKGLEPSDPYLYALAIDILATARKDGYIFPENGDVIKPQKKVNIWLENHIEIGAMFTFPYCIDVFIIVGNDDRELKDPEKFFKIINMKHGYITEVGHAKRLSKSLTHSQAQKV